MNKLDFKHRSTYIPQRNVIRNLSSQPDIIKSLETFLSEANSITKMLII